MCDVCWQYVVVDAPWCRLCATEVAGTGKRAWSVAVATALTAGALAFFASRHLPSDVAGGIWIGAALGAALAFVVAGVRANRASRNAPPVRRREPEDALVADPLERPDNPYRVRLARVAARAVPRMSARAVAGIVGASFLATASLVPVALHLPRWERTEVVLLAWWVIGVATLTFLLHSGARLTDDHAYRPPWERPADRDAKEPHAASGPSRGGSGKGWRWADLDGGVDAGDGCAGVIVGVVLAAVAFATAWLVVELVAPLVFFLFYLLLIRAVVRVTRDQHQCAGHLGRALAWGALWASTYAVPLALVVWAVHALILVKRGG